METNTENKNSVSTIESGLRLSLMGSEGSGKTCFFAGLAWLGSAAQKSDFIIKGRNERSQIFVSELRNTLARNELPPPSHNTDDLALDVLYKGTRLGINIENFAGEEFRTVGTGLQTASPLFARFLKSRYFVIFLDIENDVDRDDQASAERLDAVLTLLADERLCDGSRKLAVVLTKADLRGITRENATSPAAHDYLKSHKQGLSEKIERLGYEKEFFFLAPIGRTSLANGQPPAPFGYEALFNWLVGDIREEHLRSWLGRYWIPLAVVVVAIVLVVGIGIGYLVKRERAISVLKGENSTPAEMANALILAPQESKDEYVDREIEKMEKLLSTVDSLPEIDRLQVKITRLEGAGTESIETRLLELNERLRDKREDIHLKQIFELEAQKDIVKCREAIVNYHADQNSAKKRREEVKQIGARLDDAECRAKREKIRAAVVVSGKLHTLKERCDLIAQFDKFPDLATKSEAERAVAIGRLFFADSPYHIEIKSASGLPFPHQTRLELSNLGPSSRIQKEETNLLKSTNPQWNRSVSFRWNPGDKVQIVWWWQSQVPWTYPTELGRIDFSDPWTSLLDMLGGVDLSPVTGLCHARLNGNTPKATIICTEFPEPEKDIELFKKYLVPGTYWQD